MFISISSFSSVVISHIVSYILTVKHGDKPHLDDWMWCSATLGGICSDQLCFDSYLVISNILIICDNKSPSRIRCDQLYYYMVIRDFIKAVCVDQPLLRVISGNQALFRGLCVMISHFCRKGVVISHLLQVICCDWIRFHG